MESLTTLGRYVASAAGLVQTATFFIFGAIVVAIIVLLLLRFITSALRLNPFGRLAYYTIRPADELLHNMRSSHLYYPLKRALGFDPAILMVLIATAIVCYVVYIVMGYLSTVLWGLANSLAAFGNGQPFAGARFLIGTLLLGIVFYLLVLMTIVFVNWLFGLFRRAAYHANERIGPLLRVFEFGGIFTGWSFLILWIALVFAAAAIQTIFLSGGMRLV